MAVAFLEDNGRNTLMQGMIFRLPGNMLGTANATCQQLARQQ